MSISFKESELYDFLKDVNNRENQNHGLNLGDYRDIDRIRQKH